LEQGNSPTNPNDKPPLFCSVEKGVINCVPINSISGIIFGLQSDGLEIQLNGIESLPINMEGAEFVINFSFLNKIEEGQSYQVLIANHPSGQKCSIVNGGGVATEDVTNIQIGCFAEVTPIVESLSGKAIITWNIENAQRYDIYQSSISNFNYKEYPNFPDANMYSPVMSPYEVSPLDNGSTYYMTVVANFAGGHSIASDSVLVQPNRSTIEQIGTANSVDWGIGLYVDSLGNLNFDWKLGRWIC